MQTLTFTHLRYKSINFYVIAVEIRLFRSLGAPKQMYKLIKMCPMLR